MSLEKQIGEIVRDTLTPMLSELEERLVERIENLDRPTEKGPPEMLTRSELAEYLRVSLRTLQRKEGLPEPIRIVPSRPLWRRSEIDGWLSEGGA